jgi:heterodisulfide reductase subunit C
MARSQGIQLAEKGIVLGYDLFLESVKRLGRLYEVGLVAGVNLGTLNPLANVVDVGLPMFLKGKLNLVPGWSGSGEVKRIFVKKGAKPDADV